MTSQPGHAAQGPLRPSATAPAKPGSSRRARPGKAIDFDLKCHVCKYNVRGLNLGGPCPECGTPIELPEVVHDAVKLGDHFRPLFALDCMGMFLFGLSGLMFLGMALSGTLVGPSSSLTMTVTLGVIWLGGVLQALQKQSMWSSDADEGEFPWMLLSQWASLVSQAGVPLIPFAMYWSSSASGGGGSTTWGAIAIFLFVVAAAGWVPLGLVLSELADRYDDSKLADEFRSCALCLGVFGVGTVLVLWLGWLGTGFSNLARVFGWFIVALWVFAYAWTCVGSIRIANSMRWAVINRRAAMYRDDRLRAKAREEEQRAVVPDPVTDHEPVGPAPVALSEEPGGPLLERPDYVKPSSTEHRIDRASDTPYALEDDSAKA